MLCKTAKKKNKIRIILDLISEKFLNSLRHNSNKKKRIINGITVFTK